MSAFWSAMSVLASRRIIRHSAAQAAAKATVMPSSTGIKTERRFFFLVFRVPGAPARGSFFWLIVCLTTFAGASSVIYL